MTIAANIGLLQTINATITGITSAPQLASYPTGELSDASLPLAITWPSDGTWKAIGQDQYEHDAFYDIWVYVARNFGENFVTAKITMNGLIDGFGKKYTDEDAYAVADTQFILVVGPPLVRVRGVIPFAYQSNNDDFVIAWAGVSYHGFRFRLQLREEGTV